MSDSRTAEDHLRAEYVGLLPLMQRIQLAIETEVRHDLLSIALTLEPYEQIVVRSRLKQSESAVDALRRRQELGRFVPDATGRYTLSSLPDLVGIRVLVFPHRLLNRVHGIVRAKFADWKADPIVDSVGQTVAFKYHGRRSGSDGFEAEIQVVSMLVGLFWEVEHSAVYKTSPSIERVRALRR
jgi:ppGpp synthetase/RelA/SpoT-type nucleotidyltranferase